MSGNGIKFKDNMLTFSEQYGTLYDLCTSEFPYKNLLETSYSLLNNVFIPNQLNTSYLY